MADEHLIVVLHHIVVLSLHHCSKRYTLHHGRPDQSNTIDHDFPGKHPTTLQLMSGEYSYINPHYG